MIEEGLFARFLKPLLQKKNEKEAIQVVLNKYLQKECDFEVRGLVIQVRKLSHLYKKELSLQKSKIENDLEETFSKKYTISF